MSKKKVAVLMGGWSAEREVSLMSGEPIVKTLRESGHEVFPIDVTRDLRALMDSLEKIKPDVVFNALHGTGGEDGVIQGVLETLHIPYTHSGVAASAVGMNKIISRRIFEGAGLPTPEWKVVSVDDFKKGHPFEPPYVIKPISDGSSKGVYIIRRSDEPSTLGDDWTFGDDVLVEKFIAGREIQVGVMGDKALGAIEIKPKQGFYDYEAKYTDGKADHLMPAPIDQRAYEKALEIGLKAHQLLDCRGVSRSDLIYDELNNKFYLLELNTQPGMTPLSLLPEIAAHAGVPFPQLLNWLVDNAQCDQ